MSILPIITGEDNPILRAMSEPVTSFDEELSTLAMDLVDTMKKAKGLGIAAPQVGQNVRIFIVTLDFDTSEEHIVAMVNPEILSHSAEMMLGEEGCLSLPGRYGKVERFRSVKVKYCDLDGKSIEKDLEGLDARVVQHELDHLNGVLFIDRMKEMEDRENLML